ncbi:hypothetical protein Tco_1428866 [Tanacetum coccineum]
MDFYLHTNDQISLGCFQAFHCDVIMGQMSYQFQGNQRDYFSNDTFRGRSLVSSVVYYEVTPLDTFPLRHIFWGVTIMVEPEVPLKKKDQVALDEEMARNLEAQLQAKLIKEERLARQKEEEANIALLES